jgi:hypothetical protein
VADAERGSGLETGAERAPLRLGSIEIADDGIAERSHGRRAVFVPRASVERVTVVQGFTCERPIAALLGTVICLGGAAIVFWGVISSFDEEHAHIRLRLLVWAMLPAVVGAMFLWTLIRRGRYLRVDTARGSRKLQVHGKVNLDALRELLQLGRSHFGYQIDTSSLDNL